MLKDAEHLTGSTSRLLATFRANKIPCEVVNDRLNLITYQTKHGEWRQLKGMVSDVLPLFSKLICDDKLWTVDIFEKLGVPTPETQEFISTQQLVQFINKHQAIVLKPRSGAHGHGVTMNITKETDCSLPIRLAKSFDSKVLVQQQVLGKDLRILVVGGKVLSAVERRPASVIGNGKDSVIELIHLENNKPQRGKLGIDTLVEISIDAARRFLSEDELGRIPEKGEHIRVVGPSNQSMGGTVHDVTDQIPERIKNDAALLASKLQLPIAGIDCIVTNDEYYFLEINVSPGIAIHDDPGLGIVSGCFVAYMKLLHDDEWWRDTIG